jgi:hypothetical protein
MRSTAEEQMLRLSQRTADGALTVRSAEAAAADLAKSVAETGGGAGALAVRSADAAAAARLATRVADADGSRAGEAGAGGGASGASGGSGGGGGGGGGGSGGGGRASLAAAGLDLDFSGFASPGTAGPGANQMEMRGLRNMLLLELTKVRPNGRHPGGGGCVWGGGG